jgi:hypothetical protein
MALSSWIGPITRVACHAAAWDTAVDRIVTNGWAITVEDLPSLQPNTIMVISADERRMTILVVPAATPGGVARTVMDTAAARDTVASAAEILSSNGIEPHPQVFNA